MKKFFLACCFLSVTQFAGAVVNIGHVENATVGQVLSSSGAVLSAGGVAVGIFTSTAPASFSGFSSYADIVSAGFKDVRTFTGASQGTGFDWDFPGSPNAASGTEQNIAFSDLPAGTQLWIFAFNGGAFANGFSGSTEWAVIKDTADHLSPSDNGTKSLLLNTVSAADVLVGTDNGVNVNMAALGAAPEPSRLLLVGLGAVGMMVRRRRKTA